MGRGVLNKSVTIEFVDGGITLTKIEFSGDECKGYRKVVECGEDEAKVYLEQFIKENV